MAIASWKSGGPLSAAQPSGAPLASAGGELEPIASGLIKLVSDTMSDSEKAAKVMEALKAAEREPTQIALPILNGIVGLVQGDHEQRLEVEEARSSAFLAICEVGKALHGGQPADGLWAAAISATERWMALAR